METIEELFKLFATSRFTLEVEKQLQLDIYSKLAGKFQSVRREVALDGKNIIDFLVNDNCGVEVKLRGSKREIYYQCERYTRFKDINSLVLVTNKSLTLPALINGKKCYAINLSKSWL